MNINPAEIIDYCARNGSPLSDTCAELERFTRENVPMAVMLSGPVVGGFLGFLVWALHAKRVLEVGTYTGYSALCIAEKLPEGGMLVTLDSNAETTAIARRFWNKAGVDTRIRPILGDALTTIESLEGPFDLVFIDADKANYPLYLTHSLRYLSSGGVIVCDNALYDGEVLEPASASANGRAMAAFNEFVTRLPNIENVLLPVRDGLQIVRKKKSL